MGRYYKQPAVQKPISSFAPYNYEFVQGRLDNWQNRYDVANNAMAKTLASLYETETMNDADLARKDALIQGVKDKFTDVEKRYLGDFGAGYNEITDRIATSRKDPFWNAAKQNVELQKELQKEKVRLGPNMLTKQEVSSAYDPDTGTVRSYDEMNYDIMGKEDWIGKSMQIGNMLKPDSLNIATEAAGMDKREAQIISEAIKTRGLDGGLAYAMEQGVSPEKIKKLLGDKQLAEAFVDNTKSYYYAYTGADGYEDLTGANDEETKANVVNKASDFLVNTALPRAYSIYQTRQKARGNSTNVTIDNGSEPPYANMTTSVYNTNDVTSDKLRAKVGETLDIYNKIYGIDPDDPTKITGLKSVSDQGIRAEAHTIRAIQDANKKYLSGDMTKDEYTKYVNDNLKLIYDGDRGIARSASGAGRIRNRIEEIYLGEGLEEQVKFRNNIKSEYSGLYNFFKEQNGDDESMAMESTMSALKNYATELEATDTRMTGNVTSSNKSFVKNIVSSAIGPALSKNDKIDGSYFISDYSDENDNNIIKNLGKKNKDISINPDKIDYESLYFDPALGYIKLRYKGTGNNDSGNIHIPLDEIKSINKGLYKIIELPHEVYKAAVDMSGDKTKTKNFTKPIRYEDPQGNLVEINGFDVDFTNIRGNIPYRTVTLNGTRIVDGKKEDYKYSIEGSPREIAELIYQQFGEKYLSYKIREFSDNNNY